MPTDIVNATVIAASVTAFVGAFVSPLVAAWLGSRTRTHEARVKIAAEAHLRLLDRQINDVGDLRTRMRSVLSEIHRFANEAYFHGASEEALRLVRSCRDLVRATASAGPYVPPDVLEECEGVIQDLEDAINQIAEWSKEPDKAARYAAAQKTNSVTQRAAARSRAIFGRFQRELLNEHDRTLGLDERRDRKPREGERTRVDARDEAVIRVDPSQERAITEADEPETREAITAVRATPPKERKG